MICAFSTFPRLACLGLVSALLVAGPLAADDGRNDKPGKHRMFKRIATFPAYLNTDIGLETVAEIVAASEDGKTLVYTDAATGNIGFVDIADPADPQPLGVVGVSGEPTSVAVAKRYALAAVNTSPSFTAPSGELVVIDIVTRTIVKTFDLGGQPDAVAVSPNRRFAAIAIENERDEDLGDGRPPQPPGGFLVIVDIKGKPGNWSLRRVEFDGIADLFPDDPEPEYVDISVFNVAAVTLQENNHIILVHLPTGRILNDFSAGDVNLVDIDTLENDLIELNGALNDLPREPDGIAWVSPFEFATADEGDLDGGSRGFTLFRASGRVAYNSASDLEQIVTRLGHFPEGRAENKGNEPENVEFGRYGFERLLFVGSERASVIFVYKLGLFGRDPELLQVLPAGYRPEGLLAIPKRGLFVAASEEDDRGDKYRASLTIYQRTDMPAYPTVVSADRENGLPIPWGALSGLAIDPEDDDVAYAVHDSFYIKSRIFSMDVSEVPAVISGEIVLLDTNGFLSAVAPASVNADRTVNLDLEGVAARVDGGFWVVSEGAGSVDDASRPITSLNLLLRVAANGDIETVATLPAETNARQRRFGFEGVSAVGGGAEEQVYVVVQREWVDDPDDRVRVARYTPASDEWRFYYYPLEAPTSPNGGWVGLSDIVSLGDEEFAVIERDNQAGTDARVKHLYTFSVAGLTPLPEAAAGATPAFPEVSKTLARDLLDDLKAPGGAVLEKIEGLAVSSDGDALIVNDNDGVDDSNGETQLLRLEALFEN